MESEETLYSILGVQPNADIEEITERYRILAREYHPDVNPSHHDIALFIKVRKAYETLKIRKTREEYDKTLGIYHAKDTAAKFMKDSSHRILREKLEGIDELINDNEITPLSVSQLKAQSRKGGFLKNLKNLIFKSSLNNEDNEIISNKKNNFETKPIQETKKRNYQFTIDTLESILGAERIIVLEEIGDSQISIKVKIPKGVLDQTILNIFHPTKGTIPIKINITPHPQIKRDELDVTLLVPFNRVELEQLQTYELYTCKTKISVSIPAKTNIPLRIKNHGLKKINGKEIGDFYIQPYDGGHESPVQRISIQNLLEPLQINQKDKNENALL